MQFDNSYSEMNIQNKNGFKLMGELQPSLVIPTHFSIDAAEYVKTIWPCYYTKTKMIKISKKDISKKGIRLLFMTSVNQSYAEISKATKWK